MKWQNMQLSRLCSWAKERVALASLTPSTYISTENMLKNRGGVSVIDFVPTEGNTQEFRRGDILISNIRPYFKKIWLAKYHGGCSNDVLVVRANPEINIRWLYYVLSSDAFFDYDTANSGGGKMPRGSRTAIMKFQVAVPDVNIQRKIADILGAYDDLIEKNRRRIELLEKMARELYRERFVRRAKDECQRVTVADVCVRIGSGGTPSRKVASYWDNGDVDWFKTKELHDDWLIDSEEKISDEGLNNSAAKIYGATSIVMAIYASPTVGRLGVLTKDACTNQAALCLVANEKVVSWQWLFFLLQDKREYFNRIAAGAGQQNISAEVVKSCEFDLPEKDAIDKFTNVVGPMFEERLLLSLENRNLARQRDRLLLRLMSGKIDLDKLVKEAE